MNRSLYRVVMGLIAITAIAAYAQESHLTEAQSGTILSRSAFAHGYRHGYEEGFHQGNMDANMVRPMKTKFSQFKGLPLGYSSAFGPRKSFELGYQSGLKPGYADGYMGHPFRAITLLRSAAEGLGAGAAPADPQNHYFDRGLSAGYYDGFHRGLAEEAAPPHVDLHLVACPQFNASGKHGSAQPSYCDGYRRGYVLGQADGITLHPEMSPLEASR